MKDNLAPSLGSIVISKAGRDKMRSFIVVEVVDENFVKISDGDLRKIEKPKLKKIKHLNISKSIAEEIRDLLLEGAVISDAKLRKAIADFTFAGKNRA